MSTVWRIALTYFQILPLQRWLNLAGLLLLAVAVPVALFADTVDDAKGVFMLCLFGVMLIMVVPALGGGIALRLASRPTIAHLRPHGKLKVLLGTTLAMTLIVIGLSVPPLAANAVMTLNGLQPANRFGEPVAVLAIFWPLAAVSWIILFAASRTMVGALVFPLVVMGAMKVSFLLQTYPQLTAILVVTIGPAAWLLFALWYLRAGAIRQPQSPFATAGSEQYSFQWLLGAERPRDPVTSPAAATFHYLLGVGTYWIYLMTGVWTALLFLLMQAIIPRAPLPGESLMMVMLPFMTLNSAVMGYTTARRARILWLRTGADRTGIFRTSERLGLCASMITWGVVGGAVVVYALVMNPERALPTLLYVVAQGVAAVSMFYGGFALVKDWSARDKAITLGLIVLFLLQLVALGPRRADNPLQSWTWLLLVAGALALGLRWYALRQWRVVDWRLIRPARLDFRRSA